MQIKSFLFATLCLLTVAACHKHDDTDTIAPVLTITSPAADASIAGAVAITGAVTDESLHELLITVTKDSDGSVLFVPAVDPEVHDLTSYVINETWTPVGITAETAVTLTVTAEDHNSNKVVKTVKFKVKP